MEKKTDGSEVSENTSGSQSKSKKLIISIAIGVVVLAAIIGIGIALAQNSSVEPAPSEATEVKETVSQSTVVLEIICSETSEIIVPATIEILDKDKKSAIKEMNVTVNEKTEIGTLDEGTYTLHVMSAPIEADGSTYVLPKTSTKVTVGTQGKEVSVSVKLERLAVEDMTKEQLEIVAAIVEEKAPEHAELVVSLREKATEAISDPVSDEEVKTESTSTDVNNTEAKPTAPNSSSSVGAPSSGTNTESTGGSSTPAPTHTHAYTIPITSDTWIVTVPAQPAVAEQGYWIPTWRSGGIVFYDYESAREYSIVNKVSISNSEEYVVTVPAQPAVAEQGYWQSTTTGYKCSCGAIQ